jgi:hypothetical protein
VRIRLSPIDVQHPPPTHDECHELIRRSDKFKIIISSGQ